MRECDYVSSETGQVQGGGARQDNDMGMSLKADYQLWQNNRYYIGFDDGRI